MQTAVKALGAIRSEQALLELEKFLDNSSRYVRQMAAKILNSIVLDEPVSTSSKDLDDQNSYIFKILCQLAGELLGELKSEQAIPALVQALNDLNLDVRKAAIKALTRIGSEQARSELTKAFFSNLDTRQILTNLFTDNRCGQLFTTINQAFSDPMNYVDESKIDMPKEINFDRSIPTLIKLLDHPTANEREQAAQALGAIRCEQAVNSLIPLLKDPVSLVRGSSAQALGAIGSKRAINALVQSLNDPVSGVRWRVAEALGHIASERAINGLITALEDSDPMVREIAADAMGKIEGDNVTQNLSLLVRMLPCKG